MAGHLTPTASVAAARSCRYASVPSRHSPCTLLRVESGAHFEEARDAAPCADGAGGGCGHAAQQLEERALAGAVTPDDSHDVALFHLEVDVLQGPHVFAVALVRAVVDFAHLEVGVLAAQHLGLPEPVQVVAERPGAH